MLGCVSLYFLWIFSMVMKKVPENNTSLSKVTRSPEKPEKLKVSCPEPVPIKEVLNLSIGEDTITAVSFDSIADNPAPSDPNQSSNGGRSTS
ncbi:unnamed protein product [Blepharisma stoltei]|uniref:ATP synthase F0 subunit 8 n=1 Tax=Blepharisma stoltei TaxID=1481888 RepID=A0AAU9IV54_9CILI|nr:unnamed protein product [Blepharisma stoltei]